MIDPTYQRQADELQAALARLAPNIQFCVDPIDEQVLEGSELPHYHDMVCVVRATAGDRAYMLPVSRPMLEREGPAMVARMVVPEIRHELTK
jgi:hypothetical protein